LTPAAAAGTMSGWLCVVGNELLTASSTARFGMFNGIGWHLVLQLIGLVRGVCERERMRRACDLWKQVMEVVKTTQNPECTLLPYKTICRWEKNLLEQ